MEEGVGGKRWVGGTLERGRGAQGASVGGAGAAAGPLPGGRGQEPRSLPVGGAAGVPEGRGPSRARGPTSTAPGLRQRPARRRTPLPGALARGSISRGHCPESRIRTSGPLTGPHSSAPWRAPRAGQAQLPDGRGRLCCTRTLATLRFLGNLTVLRRKIRA